MITVRSPQFSVEVVAEISDLSLSDWPVGAEEDRLYLTHPWLLSQQGSAPDARYLVVRDVGSSLVVAVLPCRVVRSPDEVRFDNCPRVLTDLSHPRPLVDSLPPEQSAQLREMAARLRQHGELGYPALVATAPNAALFGYAVRERTAHREVMTVLIEAFERLADDLGAATRAFWYVRDGEYADLTGELVRRGYLRSHITADSRLAVRWRTFEEYISWLPHRRRHDVKGEIRDFVAAGLRVEVSGPDQLSHEIAELSADHLRRFGFPADEEAVYRGFRRLADDFGARIRVFVARDDGRALGFAMFIEHDGILYCRSAGFSGAHGRSGRFVYFNTLFYAVIRFAIENNMRHIEYGTESFEAKQRRGCTTTPLMAYIAPTSPLLGSYIAGYDAAALAYLAAQRAEIVRPEVKESQE